MSDDMENQELLYFNGIDGATGDYGMPPMSSGKLAGFITGGEKPENLDELKFRHTQGDHYGLAEGIDPKNLAASGWGIIFTHDADPAVKEALSELIALRKDQAGERFRIYEKGDGYRPGETKPKFLARHNVSPGPVDPERMPYYLMIAGSPAAIPYEFQYQLDVQFAVGRICFNTLQEYANYAAGVKAAETGKIRLPREMSFFGVANSDDKATNLSADYLVKPLFERLTKDQPDWRFKTFLKDEANKARLSRLLGGDMTPALLFTASHGMSFPLNDSRQIPHQGALLCQDWPGPLQWKGKGSVPQDFYFAGEDLTQEANLLGLIAFYFACYGAGTPLNDEFSKQSFKKREAIAPYPFLAGLPTKMLSHSKGSALAVVGHVERAWGYSFAWPGVEPQTTVFESTLKRLLEGHPVGSAFEFFDDRYAELASDLSIELEEIEYGKKPNPYELAGIWTANNDARSYVILGDPAVRLPVAAGEDIPAERPVIEVKASHQADEQPILLEEQTDDPVSEKSAQEIPPSPSHKETSEPESAVSKQESEPSPRPPNLAETDFGLFDMGKSIADSLKDISVKLTEMLSRVVDDLTSLEVMTYTADNLENIEYDAKTKSFGESARLKAYTRVELDGDMINLIPERLQVLQDGEEAISGAGVDEKLWHIHQTMVAQAQTGRLAFVKALAEVAGTLIK